jgi:4-hydroxyphenylpyruvate dioxygenase
MRLALHKWTLDSTPLPEALVVARRTGWEGIELRRGDFDAAIAAGLPPEGVLDTLRASGLALAAVGVELGWMFAEGPERRRLLRVFAEQCARAVALGCPTLMSPSDLGRGDLGRAAASVREVGDIAARHGLRLAIEFMCQAEQFNTLARARELIARADHPACGILVDTYHWQRSGGDVRALDDVGRGEIVYVQYSDVPPRIEPGNLRDRLPPGQGVVPFVELFERLAKTGYTGWLSYEAPNPAAWARDAEAVAREAIEATRAVLPARA